MSIQADVAGHAGQWVGLIAAVVRNNPYGDIYDILARTDVADSLNRQLQQARQLVTSQLEHAWAPEASGYRASLESDVSRAYNEAAAGLRQAAIAAFQSVPPASFVSGVTRPGVNPATLAAAERSDAVARAASSAAWHLGMRNELTVAVARVRRVNENILSTAPPGTLKKWATRGDSRVCDWCLALSKMDPIPVHAEFSYGEAAGRRQPPRVYLDLMCPPRHPRCRCRIILVNAGVPVTPGSGRAAVFVSAAHVRAMQPDRYHALREFHSAALYQLGPVVRSNREAGNQ